MAILGNNTTPGTGFFFDDTGNRQMWTTRQFTMPAGGGIMTDINAYFAGDGTTVSARIVLWDNSNNVFYQTSSFTLASGTQAVHGQAWVTQSVASVYVPAGNYSLGFWSSGHLVWTFQSTGGVRAKAASGSPATNTGTTDEYGGGGFGELGVYLTYTPGGIARVNTGTSGSPVWTVGQVVVNTGTSGTPVWTNARVQVNTGTSGSPTWTDAV